MSGPSLNRHAAEALRLFPVARTAGAPAALGNRGGFSGARLWRVEGNPPFCLRAWPPGAVSAEALSSLHRLMNLARASGLGFVPAVFATGVGVTAVERAGRLWEVTSWMPGRADFRDRPTAARLRSACAALARLHLAWAVVAPAHGPCPALLRRLQRYREWQEMLASGWRPDFADPSDPVRPWAERAWTLLGRRLGQMPSRLTAWASRSVPLQPCLCDVWHDHVLFEGEAVTGLIDYGGVKRDHVAADLARLLGSLAGDDRGAWAVGLEAYARLRPLSADEEALARALDETGTLIGMANWLRWLYREGRAFEDREAVARRLAELVRRVETWE